MNGDGASALALARGGAPPGSPSTWHQHTRATPLRGVASPSTPRLERGHATGKFPGLPVVFGVEIDHESASGKTTAELLGVGYAPRLAS